MKVIVNGRFLLHKITGVERYAREILLELDKLIQPGEIEIAIPPEAKDVSNYKNIKTVRVGKFNNRLWEHISFPMYVKKQKAISLNLCNVAPLSSPGIVCIHDMKIKAHPEFFSRKFKLWYEILFKNETSRAKKIITVSEFSKKEIIKYYKVPEEKIFVIPNAWQHYERIGFDENTLSKYGLKKNCFYFAMGSMDPNKNFKWIEEKAKEKPFDTFAIAGSINEKVFAEGVGFECPPNMKLLGFISDEEAKTLMRDCKAFLFPSIYEGFGIPPLEAMSAGCKKIIVSDTEVMHEIFGDSVIYLNEKCEFSIEHNSSVNEMILNQYSWRDSATRLFNMLYGKEFFNDK